MTKKLDKFKVGDTAWAKGDPYRRPVLWTEYRVLERTKTGYVIQRPGVSYVSSFAGNVFYKPETVSAIKVNRGDYLTTQEKEDWVWAKEHRYKISDQVERVDAALLRKVAEVIGYKPEAKP